MAETSKPEMSRMQWIVTIGVLISIISLSVTIIGPNTITSSFSRLVSPPTADFTIESYSTPQILPFSFLYSLNTSPDYYVTTSIQLSTDYPYVGNSFYISISFDNKGKNSVSEPYVTIYFLDEFSREWGSWNQSLTNGEFSNGISIAYNFPTLDQKSVGAWSVITVLYDNATGQLVSVNTSEFTTTDIAPPPAWETDLLFVFFFVVVIVTAIAVVRKARIDRKKAQERKKKRAERKAEKEKKGEKEGTGES